MKVELRVAKVLAAERVPKSKKLLKLQVDVGTEQRTLVAGIAEAYEPERSSAGRSSIVFNLKPAKLMGIESNGMVLAASPDGGKPTSCRSTSRRRPARECAEAQRDAHGRCDDRPGVSSRSALLAATAIGAGTGSRRSRGEAATAR